MTMDRAQLVEVTFGTGTFVTTFPPYDESNVNARTSISNPMTPESDHICKKSLGRSCVPLPRTHFPSQPETI